MPDAIEFPCRVRVQLRSSKDEGFFENYDSLLCHVVTCPPFDVNPRYPSEVDGVRFEGYMGWLILTYAITVTACPAMSLPCGFTRAGLPVGLQVVGKPRGEAELFSAAAYIEALLIQTH